VITFFFASVLLGAVSGIFAGLFGLGGRLVIVPILAMLLSGQGVVYELTMIMAVATSLATIIFTSMASARAHHRLGAVVWHKVFNLVPGIVIGTIAGAVIADLIAADVLRYIFIAYLLAVGTQLALQVKPSAGVAFSKSVEAAVAVVIGLLSAILGIGGGTLVVPYLLKSGVPMHNAVAVASACGGFIALVGAVSFMLLGWNIQSLPAWSFGYIYLPAFFGIALSSIFTAPMGAKLASKLPAKQLKRYFSLLLFVMAAKLIWH